MLLGSYLIITKIDQVYEVSLPTDVKAVLDSLNTRGDDGRSLTREQAAAIRIQSVTRGRRERRARERRGGARHASER